jgi:hypothetical protein
MSLFQQTKQAFEVWQPQGLLGRNDPPRYQGSAALVAILEGEEEVMWG